MRATRAIPAVLALAAALCAIGVRFAAAQQGAALELPARPLAVLDRTGHLGDARAQRLSVALLRHRADTGQAVLVLILDPPEGAPLADLARLAADRWALQGNGQDEAALLAVARSPLDAAAVLSPALAQHPAARAARLRLEERIRARADADGLVAAVDSFLVELRREAEERAEQRGRAAAELQPQRQAAETRAASPDLTAAPVPDPTPAPPPPRGDGPAVLAWLAGVPTWQLAAAFAAPAALAGWLAVGALGLVLRRPPSGSAARGLSRLALATPNADPEGTKALRGAAAQALALDVGDVGRIQRSAASAAALLDGGVLLLAARTIAVPPLCAAGAAAFGALAAGLVLALLRPGETAAWLGGPGAAALLAVAAGASGPLRARLVSARLRRSWLRAAAAAAAGPQARLVLAVEARGRLAAIDADAAVTAGVGAAMFDLAAIALERALRDRRAADGIVAAVGTSAALLAERRRDRR